MSPVAVSPYTVSTITCNGSIGACIDLATYFRHAHIAEDPAEEGIVRVELDRGHTRGTETRRHPAPHAPRTVPPPHKPQRPCKIVRNCFENQVTNLVRMRSVPSGAAYLANVKLFRNGGVQATGIRSEADGHRMLRMITEQVKRLASEGVAVITGDDKAEVGPRDFRIAMINTNFKVDYKVRRKTLQDLLVSEPFGMRSFFNAPYPGVKCGYYWNTHNHKQGICHCSTLCKGKGRGDGEGRCKKVTICVFESGSALITGGNDFKQVDEVYAFIKRVLVEHADQIRKKELGPAELTAST